MQHLRIIQLLRGLKKEEFKLFEKFLQSSYFKASKNAARLFKVLVAFHPSFNQPTLESKGIYYQVYSKDKNYSPNNFRSLLAELTRLLNQFFLLQELDKRSEQKDLLLTDAYFHREIDSELALLIKNVRKQKEKTSPQFFLDRFHLYWKFHEKEGDNFSLKNDFFTDCNKNLDSFFVAAKLKLGIEHTNLTKRFDYNHPIYLVSEIQNFVNKSVDINKVFLLHAELLQLYKNQQAGIKELREIGQHYETYLPFLEKTDARDISNSLFNYANASIRAGGGIDFQHFAFYLLQLGVKNKLYLKNNLFQNGIFFNIVVLGSSLQHFEWVENFMSTYEPFLAKKTKALDINTSKAVFLYFKGKTNNNIPTLTSSAQILEGLTSRNPKYYLRIKFNLLKVYYEIFIRQETGNSSEKLNQLIRSFSTYLIRPNSLNEPKKRRYLQTITIIKKLAKERLNPNISPEQCLKMIKELVSLPFYSNAWIEEMIGEFLQKKKVSFPPFN